MKRLIYKIHVKSMLIFFLVLIMLLSFSACYQSKEREYYSNKENYITEEAIIDNIIYNKDENSLYFWLSDIDDLYHDSTFKIQGKNLSVVLERGIIEKAEIGSKITYTSAPEYFGDGYCMPIVAISIAGEELLCFHEGFDNFMEDI